MSVIPLKVVVRVRPLIQKEKDEGCQTCLSFIPYEPQIVLGKDRNFTFDFVFRQTDPQITVFEDAVKPLTEHIFKGYNATVLAYGQTGSGKTFTMGGGYEESLKMDPEGMGVIPRIVQEIFLTIADKEKYKYKTHVSYLEIINEELQDLLVSGKKDSLMIREENGVIKLPGLREIPVSSTEEVMKYLEQGCNNRTTAATAMNNTSSRSHAVFSLMIEQHNEEDINDFWKVKLQLVDLAGSERIKKTHAEGARLKEGININKGLLALGNVISILGDETKKGSHVPYRDSKLTRILQDSLGGNSHTLMIACVSPADSNMEETLNTLRYADRARKIKNKPVVNWDPQTAENMRLKEQVQQLTMKLISAGLTELDSDVDLNLPKQRNSPKKEDSKTLQMWMDKCNKFEAEVESLHKELILSVDQAVASATRAQKWENKWERLKALLEDFENTIGVDFDLLSSSITEETDPAVAEQVEKLKNLFSKLNEFMGRQGEPDPSDPTENSIDVDIEEEEVLEEEAGAEVPCNDETREMLKQHTLKRARLNTELTELQKQLEKKEKLVSKMAQNDKLKELKEQYEVSMKQLEEEIASLQKEKEGLSSALEDARNNAAASKLSEARRKRLQELESQMTELKRKLADQKKLLKVKDQTDKKVLQLNTEIQNMKTQRVKLMKQMKEDADQWKKWRQEKDKEVLQLQQKDRKRQFEIQKLQRENQRTHNVLQRKSEEAAAANRRLKEALAKQKQVMEDRNQKFDKCDKNTIGNRIRKLLSNELDVQVSVVDSKFHRDRQLEDRKLLAEQLKTLKESLSDDAPPSKKMAWMDDTGLKHETSFEEEETKKKVHHLEQQIELLNVQIADSQQKIFDAEQDVKGKTTKDNLHTMMEAKIAIKWLLDQAVNYKADNNRLQSEMNEIKHSQSDNTEDIRELEERINTMKKEFERKVTRLQSEHEEEIEVLMAHTNTISRKDSDRQTDAQVKELEQLKQENETQKKTILKLERNLTKFMYKDKNVALLPELTDDETEPREARSPFVTQRPKRSIASRTVLGIIQADQSNRSSDEFEKPPRPPMRKSVSAGMLRNKRKSKLNDDDKDYIPRKKNLVTDLSDGGIGEEDAETKEQYVKKLRKRSGRYNLQQLLADEVTDTNDDEEEPEEEPKKAKITRKRTSKTNLVKVESEECIADIPNTATTVRPMRKKPSKSNIRNIESETVKSEPSEQTDTKPAKSSLNETFTSVTDDSEKSTTLNETFTTTQDNDDNSLDIVDEGIKRKRRLYPSKSFFKPVEFADSNV